jgi:uroporphyrin-III C-methyltransferase
LAVIENASRPNMRVVRGLLAALPELVKAQAIKSPALILIGDVTARKDAAIVQTAQAAAGTEAAI